MKLILAVNAGSSSVKISLYSARHADAPKRLAEVQISGLSSQEPKLKYIRGPKESKQEENAQDVPDHDAAFDLILKTLLQDDRLAEMQSKDDISIVCHRVVHGGDYKDIKIVKKEVYHHLQDLTDLAPLHNGPALSIMRSCIDSIPSATNIACFDSQFHTTMPPYISTYPIDPEFAKKNGLRKYGFHGISYSFVTRAASAFLNKKLEETNLIILHLGSGASVCAVKNGQSYDTSMGLTPLDGLPGATRSGGLDPSLIFHYTSNASKLSSSSTKEIHISEAEEILNKQCGWKSLTGTTDFAKICEFKNSNDKLAFDIFVNRICGFIGSYYVALQGRIHAIVFAGGIGESSAILRESVVRNIQCLGFEIDGSHQKGTSKDSGVENIGSSESKHAVLVCNTDEQYEMARMCSYKTELWE